MDSLPPSTAQSAFAHIKPDPRGRCSSPFSVSDSESQYSFDSASSQESAASTATTLSTLWQQPLDSDGSVQNKNARVEEWSKTATSYPKAWLLSGSGGSELAPLPLRPIDQASAHRQCLKSVSEYRTECRPTASTFAKCSPALRHERAEHTRSSAAFKLEQSSPSQTLSRISNAVHDDSKTARDFNFDHYFPSVCSKLRESRCIDSVPRTEIQCSSVQESTHELSAPASVAPSHPRRCSASSTRSKPSLVRQCDRRQLLVEHLVAIQSSQQKQEPRENSVISLRDFVRETLKRSRTSYSTLQVTLYYLCLIKSQGKMPKCDFTGEQGHDSTPFRSLQCGRRMFLAALILASKYLQDQNYSAKAWSKITGLKVQEITFNEMSFLGAVDYRLHIKDDVYHDWVAVVTRCTEAPSFGTPQRYAWTSVLDMMSDKVSIRRISTLLLPSTWTENRETDPASDEAIRSFHANTFAKHSEPVSTTNFETRVAFDANSIRHNQLPVTSPPSEDVVPPSTVVPPTPNLGATLETPVVTPWPASHGACTPAVGSTPSLDSSRSSSQASLTRIRQEELPASIFSQSAINANSSCFNDIVRRQLCGIQRELRSACPSKSMAAFSRSSRLTESPDSLGSADYLEDRMTLPVRNFETSAIATGFLTPPHSDPSESSDEDSADASRGRSNETPKAASWLYSRDSSALLTQQTTSRPTTAIRNPTAFDDGFMMQTVGFAQHAGQYVGARSHRPAYQRSVTSPEAIKNVRGILRRECSNASVGCDDFRHSTSGSELQRNVSQLLCSRSQSAYNSPVGLSSSGAKKRSASECEESQWTAIREHKIRRLVEKASHAHWIPCEQ